MQRVLAERERRPALQLVVVDPRRTPSLRWRRLHLPLRSGTDVMLFNGLLAWLAEHGHTDTAYVAAHTQGLGAALEVAAGRERRHRGHGADLRAGSVTGGTILRAVRGHTGAWSRVLAGREPVLGRHRQGQQHHQLPSGHRAHRPRGHGTVLDHRSAECHGWARSGRSSPTQLAAHLDLENAAHRAAVREFWGCAVHRRSPGPEGRRTVRSHRCRRACRPCGSWRPIRW